jgi:hypothetical protein
MIARAGYAAASDEGDGTREACSTTIDTEPSHVEYSSIDTHPETSATQYVARFAGSLAPRLFARGMEENLNRFRTMIEGNLPE